jgi:hypothetical protein
VSIDLSQPLLLPRCFVLGLGSQLLGLRVRCGIGFWAKEGMLLLLQALDFKNSRYRLRPSYPSRISKNQQQHGINLASIVDMRISRARRIDEATTIKPNNIKIRSALTGRKSTVAVQYVGSAASSVRLSRAAKRWLSYSAPKTHRRMSQCSDIFNLLLIAITQESTLTYGTRNSARINPYSASWTT